MAQEHDLPTEARTGKNCKQKDARIGPSFPSPPDEASLIRHQVWRAKGLRNRAQAIEEVDIRFN